MIKILKLQLCLFITFINIQLTLLYLYGINITILINCLFNIIFFFIIMILMYKISYNEKKE